MGKDENKDLLDLCTLQTFEDNCYDTEIPGEIEPEGQRAIDWKRKQLMINIRGTGPKPSREVMEKHKQRQLKKGVE